MKVFSRKAILITVFSLFTYIFFSCGNDKNEGEIKKDVTITDQSIVRTGIINVVNIDTDNNGKLYECPMDWNVISDKEGSCPLCEMKLKEFTTAEVKENLKRFGYETVD